MADTDTLLLWLALGAGAVFWALLAYRRDLAARLATKLSPERPETHWLWATPIADDDTPPHEDLVSALQGARGRFAEATLVLGFILFLAAWFQPVTLGSWLGALLLLMLAGATWLPVGSVILPEYQPRGSAADLTAGCRPGVQPMERQS